MDDSDDALLGDESEREPRERCYLKSELCGTILLALTRAQYERLPRWLRWLADRTMADDKKTE